MFLSNFEISAASCLLLFGVVPVCLPSRTELWSADSKYHNGLLSRNPVCLVLYDSLWKPSWSPRQILLMEKCDTDFFNTDIQMFQPAYIAIRLLNCHLCYS